MVQRVFDEVPSSFGYLVGAAVMGVFIVMPLLVMFFKSRSIFKRSLSGH
jgi:hypothetical protein